MAKKKSFNWIKVDDIKQGIWPEEEIFTIDQDRVADETEENKLVGVLNVLKDETHSNDVVQRMKKITKKLRQAMKDGKIQQEGGCDFLDEMFVEKKRLPVEDEVVSILCCLIDCSLFRHTSSRSSFQIRPSSGHFSFITG